MLVDNNSYYARNRDSKLAYQAAYYQAHKEEIKQKKREKISQLWANRYKLNNK